MSSMEKQICDFCPDATVDISNNIMINRFFIKINSYNYQCERYTFHF